MSDQYVYVDSNWCPDCGEPRGVCRCEDYRAADTLVEELDEWGKDEEGDDPAWRHELDRTCPRCNGTGLDIDDISPCDHCDGAGHEWWLP